MEEMGWASPPNSLDDVGPGAPQLDQAQELGCANPNCYFLVHPDMPEGWPFCCGRCWGRHTGIMRGRKAHGEFCQKRVPTTPVPRAVYVPGAEGAEVVDVDQAFQVKILTTNLALTNSSVPADEEPQDDEIVVAQACRPASPRTRPIALHQDWLIPPARKCRPSQPKPSSDPMSPTPQGSTASSGTNGNTVTSSGTNCNTITSSDSVLPGSQLAATVPVHSQQPPPGGGLAANLDNSTEGRQPTTRPPGGSIATNVDTSAEGRQPTTRPPSASCSPGLGGSPPSPKRCAAANSGTFTQPSQPADGQRPPWYGQGPWGSPPSPHGCTAARSNSVTPGTQPAVWPPPLWHGQGPWASRFSSPGRRAPASRAPPVREPGPLRPRELPAPPPQPLSASLYAKSNTLAHPDVQQPDARHPPNTLAHPDVPPAGIREPDPGKTAVPERAMEDTGGRTPPPRGRALNKLALELHELLPKCRWQHPPPPEYTDRARPTGAEAPAGPQKLLSTWRSAAALAQQREVPAEVQAGKAGEEGNKDYNKCKSMQWLGGHD